jgi:exosortase
MTVTTAAPPARGPSSRGERLAAVAAVAIAASIFAPVAAGLVRQWYEDPNAAYGALVAIAAAFAVRQRWARVRALPRAGSWLGAAGLVGAAILYAAGTLAADLFLLRTSFVAFSAAAIWFVCGTPTFRAMAVPIVLALAAIPLPNALVTELTLPLQLGASQLATAMLGAIGIDVIRDGNVLTLSYITLEVAEACSGMRSLVTLVALVAVYWGTSGATVTRAAILAAAAVPVALAGNGLRVAFTAVLAGRIGEDAVRGIVHDATGFVTFIVMGAALVGVHVLSSRTSRAVGLAL